MIELISQLESAACGSEYLTRAIDDAVPELRPKNGTVINYTESIDGAKSLVPHGAHWGVEKIQDEKSPMRNFGSVSQLYKATCGNYGSPQVGRHNHPAIALCIAALRARLTQE